MLRPVGAIVLIATASPALAQGGRLIAADPVVETPSGTQAWKVRYLTTDDRRRSQEVTGMVVAPREAIPSQPRKVLAWTHGTWGTAFNCAPSLSPLFFDKTPAIEAVRGGYVVVAPDYPGMGSQGVHPYLVGTATARSF